MEETIPLTSAWDILVISCNCFLPPVIAHGSFLGQTSAQPQSFPPVKLNLREKQTFYHELGRFLQSGIPLPQAVESLAGDSRGSLRQTLNALLKLFLGGETVVGAFSRMQPTVGPMEVALVEASDRSGRLEQAFRYLTGYFDTLATLREGIIKRATWPIIQLHFGVILLNFAAEFLISMSHSAPFDAAHFVEQTAIVLGIFYVILIGAVIIGTFLARGARVSTGIDRFLSFVPVIGRLRRNLALSRFCAAYEMQLAAAVNVMDSARAAADASQSARIRAAIGRMIPGLMGGASIGSLMPDQTVFPAALQRAVRTGEQTGSLDEDLQHWAGYYQKGAVDALETAGVWLSRLIGGGIGAFLIYKIVSFFGTYLQTVYGPLLN